MADMKLGRLEGKLAVVTAATKGIGFAIAERLAAELEEDPTVAELGVGIRWWRQRLVHESGS